jgi:hypothetical protein
LISTTIGRPWAMSPGRAFQRCASSLPAGAGADDLALVEEVVGHLHRLVEQPARVVAQVEHQAAQVPARLLAQLLHGAAQRGLGLLVEGGQADIADVAALEAEADDLRADHVAGDLSSIGARRPRGGW